MGKKVSKSEILEEIQNKILACREYQKKDPDKTAEQRIEMLENDPCGNLTYYVNVTLKDCLPEDSVNLSDRLKHIENKRYLPLLKELNDAYETGCIITVNVSKNEGKTYNYSISASAYGSLDSLFTTLMTKYFDDSCLFSILKPKKPLIGDNYIEDDFNTAIENGKSSIVYGMARFSKPVIEEILKKQFDIEKYDLYSYDINYFYDVSYPDMTRRTSFEQNVNQFLGGGVVNAVTMFGAKGKLPNYNIKRAHGVYDMVRYVTETLNEIKNCDSAQGRKKYKKYSEGVFKEYNEAKYDTYLSLGGSTDWATWADCQGQLLTYKAVTTYDKEFREAALANGTYMSNLFAAEKTANLFTNSPMECIGESWKKETDIFKKKSVGGVSFTNSPTDGAAGAASSDAASCLVDPPSIAVKPRCGSSIEFDVNTKYEFSLAEPHISTSSDEKYDQAIMVSKPGEAYECTKGYFTSSNKININRDIIKLDSSEYVYTDVKIIYDRENELPFTNEVTRETDIYEIPEQSYYNRATHMFFLASLLDNPRVIQSTISYFIIPKKVTIPVKFIQHSRWDNREPADEHEKQAREEYKDNFLRICVDAIPYDPWERIIERLERLYGKWSALQPDKEGNFELPPIDDVNEDELDNIKCKKCGQIMRNCTCNRVRLCSKCFPLDLTGAVEEMGLDFSLFKAVTFVFNLDGTPATYSQIAKEIYNAIYPLERGYSYESAFDSISWQSLSILSVKYDILRLTPSYRVKNSLISQLERNDFENFKKEYANLILSSCEAGTKKFAKTLPIGLMDGILYMPTGHSITFDLDLATYSITLDGITAPLMKSISSLMADQTADYDTTLNTVKSLFAGNEVPENVLKYMIFPYTPNVFDMISSTKLNVCEYLESFKEEYVYKVNVSDLENAKSLMFSPDVKTVPIRFSIYLKRPVHCSYPRCTDPIYENDANNGVCELDQYFRTPTIVGLTPFSFESEYRKRKARLLVQKMRKDTKDLIDNVMSVKISACDADKNLALIDSIKLKALNALYEFGTNYRELLINVPEDPIYPEQKASVVCEAAKKAKLESIIDDYDQVFTHLMNTVLVLKEDHFNVNEQKFASIISDLTVCSDVVSRYYKEVAAKSQNYNMCSEKFSDYINDAQKFKVLDDGIVEKEKAILAKAVDEITARRIKDNEIFGNSNSLGFTLDEGKLLAKYIANGDMVGVKLFSAEHKGMLEAKKKVEDPHTAELAEALLNIDVLPFCKGKLSASSLQEAVSKACKAELSPNELDKKQISSMTDPGTLKNFATKTKSNLKV